MKRFIKIMAYVLAVPVATVTAVVTYGIYTGIQDANLAEANVASFEATMESFDGCGEGDREAYDANPACSLVCESFFQCRNDYLILEEMVNNEWVTLHEDVYTYDEYEYFYGPLDIAETVSNPGISPQPKID